MLTHIHNRHTRRHCLRNMGLVAGAAGIALPTRWTKPLVNSVILPAHAMTSCGLSIVTSVNDTIGLVVTATEVQGPITLPLSTPVSFSGSESSVVGTCANGEQQRQDMTMSGSIDSVNSQISGTLSIDIYCGQQLACQQQTNFVVTQTPVVIADDLGAYQGPLTGTLRCCESFTGLLKQRNQSLIH